MQLSDIISEVLLETGQFILGNLDEMCINKKQFLIIVKKALRFYEKHVPYTKEMLLSVPGASYTFVKDVDGFVPDWLSKVRLHVMEGLYVNNSVGAQLFGTQSSISVTHDWEYTKPTLYLAFSGHIKVTAHGSYPIEEIISSSGTLKDATIEDIENSAHFDLFITLVSGHFLQSIGRSRRLFTVDDIPVSSDAADLISEGTELEDTTKERLEAVNLWQYSLGQ